MKMLGRFYPHVIITDPKDRNAKQKFEYREAKFNFTKKANANYRKA